MGVIVNHEEQMAQHRAHQARLARFDAAARKLAGAKSVPVVGAVGVTPAPDAAPPPPVGLDALFLPLPCNAAAEQAVRTLLEGRSPARIVVVVGGHATGKSTLLSAAQRASGGSIHVVDDADAKGDACARAIKAEVARPDRIGVLVSLSEDIAVQDEALHRALAGALCVRLLTPKSDDIMSICNHFAAQVREKFADFEPSAEVLWAIASTPGVTAALATGALSTLLTRQWAGRGVTVEDAREVLAHSVRDEEPRLRVEHIVQAVCAFYSVSRMDLLSQRRTEVVTFPRQVAMCLAKRMTPRSLPEIGRRFGGRDHTTVLHSVRKINALAKTDAVLAHRLELIENLALKIANGEAP